MRHRYERLQIFFHTHGSKAVFMARFIAGVRFMAGPMAGAAGMPFFRFLGWNVLGAIVWCTLVVTIGYLVGDELYRVTEMAHHAQRWIALVAICLSSCFGFSGGAKRASRSHLGLNPRRSHQENLASVSRGLLALLALCVLVGWTPREVLKLHYLQGFVPRTRAIFSPANIAVAPVSRRPRFRNP